MEKDNQYEEKGYVLIIKLLKSLNKFFTGIAAYFSGLENKIYFQKYKLRFGERDSDIYISTFPKSGTTLTQVILYCLTTEGKMNFNHIYDVSPWIRNASYLRQKPIDLPSPRLIKTHDNYKDFPKNTKGKVIYIHRSGMDVATSMYNQQKNYNNSDLTFDNYIKSFFSSKNWFNHSKSWMENKKGLTILYIRYEDLIKNKRKEIERIIEFFDLNCTEMAIKRAIQFSGFDHMKKNESKFGDQPVEKKEKVFTEFIRSGKSGEGKSMFSDEQAKTFNKLYNEKVKEFEQKIF
jgi:hypothetical protein